MVAVEPVAGATSWAAAGAAACAGAAERAEATTAPTVTPTRTLRIFIERIPFPETNHEHAEGRPSGSGR